MQTQVTAGKLLDADQFVPRVAKMSDDAVADEKLIEASSMLAIDNGTTF